MKYFHQQFWWRNICIKFADTTKLYVNMIKTEQETRYFTTVLLTGNNMTCQWNKNKVLQLGFVNSLHKCREGVITWHQFVWKTSGRFSLCAASEPVVRLGCQRGDVHSGRSGSATPSSRAASLVPLVLCTGQMTPRNIVFISEYHILSTELTN